MKIGIGADTGDFEKGARKVKQEMKDLEKVSGDAFSTIADALGIDLGKLQQFSSALSGLGNKLAQTGKEGTTAFQAISKSIAPVAAGIAGLGLTAAIALFKQLNAEADAFEATVQGGIIAKQSEAYVSTFKQYIRDQKEVGKAASEGRSTFREWSARFFAGMNPMNNLDVLTAADEAGKKAKEYTGEILDLERKRKENAVEVAKINDRIADYTNIAKDSTNSVAARQAAMAQIEAAIAEKKALTVPLEERLAELYELRSGLAEDSEADADATLAQQQRLYDTNRAITQEETAQLKLKKQIATAASAAAAAAAEEAAAIAKGVQRMSDFAAGQIEMFVSEDSVNAIRDYLGGALAQAPIQVPVGIDITEAEQQVLELSEMLQTTLVDAIETVSASIGDLFGNLVNGEGGLQQFGQDILTMVGDFAQKFGKVLVAYGVAAKAFQAAIKNPIAAIIAGVSLIAIGAAVKQVASNMSSAIGAASYSSGYEASAASYGTGSGAYSNSTLQVEVSGTLTANGSQLVAVLNNENTRRKYTT